MLGETSRLHRPLRAWAQAVLTPAPDSSKSLLLVRLLWSSRELPAWSCLQEQRLLQQWREYVSVLGGLLQEIKAGGRGVEAAQQRLEQVTQQAVSSCNPCRPEACQRGPGRR